MNFRVLTAEGEHRKQWSGLVHRLPAERRDLHFLPEYGLIYRDAYGQEPMLACLEDAGNFVIQPFVKRDLNQLPFLLEPGITEPYFDIANAYGYGGPLCLDPGASASSALLARFNDEFSAWCASQHIASEFCCPHPLLHNHQLVAGWPHVMALPKKPVAYLDLTLAEEELWRAVNRGHRSSIQRARKAGVRVERVAANAANLTEFERLYAGTMDRHRAASRWYFPANYFRSCVERLGSDRTSLFFARSEDKVASAHLLLHDFGIAYYHFGGSDDAFFPVRPNNLLLYESALWAKRTAHRVYHLGGGVTSGSADSLLRFKSGFGGSTVTLYTYGRVHDQATYDRLCELKLAHERATRDTAATDDYFPLYRR